MVVGIVTTGVLESFGGVHGLNRIRVLRTDFGSFLGVKDAFLPGALSRRVWENYKAGRIACKADKTSKFRLSRCKISRFWLELH
jgi:hypothetical protein